MDVHKNVPLTPLGREAMVRWVNIDIKKLFRFSRTGHRITGNRRLIGANIKGGFFRVHENSSLVTQQFVVLPFGRSRGTTASMNCFGYIAKTERIAVNILADRVANLEPSPTKEVTRKASELRKTGREIISLSLGEPDFDTPPDVKSSGIEAIVRGDTKYTAVAGTTALREAIRHKFLTENGLDYQDDEITVGCGAKQVIYNAFQATLNEGDEVIVPVPYWVSYPVMISLAGGQPVYVRCPESNGFKIRPNDLDRAITSRTKWLILNSPCNPSGTAYTEKELEDIAEVLRRHSHVWIVSDDVYEYIVYDNLQFRALARIDTTLRDRVLTVNAVSKGFCMTGWRVGFGAGPSQLINAINKIQSHSTSHTSSISQAAAAAALLSPRTYVKNVVDEFAKRREFIVAALNEIPGISCSAPSGAFYVFPSCEAFIGKKTPDGQLIGSDVDFAKYLLESAGVAVVPGTAFGMSPFFRVSFASSLSDLETACMKIGQACQRIQ